MTTFYFTQNGTILEKRSGSILAVIEKEKKYFPLEQADKLVVYGNVMISNPLLNDLAYRKIPIYYYSYGGKFKGTFIPAEKNVGKVRLYQYKTYFNPERRLIFAKNVVEAASKNKLTLLKRYYNSNKNEEIGKGITQIEENVEKADDCESINSLRGYEGTITRIYYSCFSYIFKHFDFEGRNRQPPTDELNALISFGNSLLYNEIHNIAYEVGLDHFLGFLHEMDDNKPAMVLDISEVYRQPVVDSLIFETVNNDVFNEKHFNKKEGICLLNNYGKELFLRKYEYKLNKTFLYRKIKEYVSYRGSIKLDLYKAIKFFFEETNKYDAFRIY